MDRNHVSPRRPPSREGDIATRPTASKQSSLATQPASESLKFSRRILDHVADAGPSQADKEKSCDTRRRPDEEDRQKLIVMSPQLIGKTVTPFLKDHIPGLYAPLAKSVAADAASQTPGANSRYCYRHRPDSKCRRAADESKMAMIQSELDLMTPAEQQAITHVRIFPDGFRTTPPTRGSLEFVLTVGRSGACSLRRPPNIAISCCRGL